MRIEDAKRIVADNYHCNVNSFIYYLHENCFFSTEKFWEFYESIAAFIGERKDPETTRQITQTYQRLLKEIIFHFDPMDASTLDHFPKNYIDYIERLDYALLAYYSDNLDLIDNERFELQK